MIYQSDRAAKMSKVGVPSLMPYPRIVASPRRLNQLQVTAHTARDPLPTVRNKETASVSCQTEFIVEQTLIERIDPADVAEFLEFKRQKAILM